MIITVKNSYIDIWNITLVYFVNVGADDFTMIMYCVSCNYLQDGAGENVGRYPVQRVATNEPDVVSQWGDWWPAVSDYIPFAWLKYHLTL